jgi:hypothetical protein
MQIPAIHFSMISSAGGGKEMSVSKKNSHRQIACRCRPDILAGHGSSVDANLLDDLNPLLFF